MAMVLLEQIMQEQLQEMVEAKVLLELIITRLLLSRRAPPELVEDLLFLLLKFLIGFYFVY